MERLTFPCELELKSEDEASGVIHGYASTFGNVDKGFDVVEPGAFADSIATKSQVPVLWQHDPSEPIGVGTVHEDRHGLKSKTQLVMSVGRAKDAHALAKAGALGGLSIGFITKDHEFDDAGVRHIKKADLMEYSLVTFPMNSRAQITSVKGLETITERDMEKILRDAGFNQTEAKQIISEGFKALKRGKRDVDSVEVINSLEALKLHVLGRKAA